MTPQIWIGEDDAGLLEVGTNQRNLPPPPHIVFAALVRADAVEAALPGSWLSILADEQPPTVLASEHPSLVVWSSLWPARQDAVIRFELPAGKNGDGTDLRWVLLVEKPPPPGAALGHMFKRINQLINANLRYTFG